MGSSFEVSRRYAALVLGFAALAGCASHRHDVARDSFSPSAPFSKTIAGSGDAVCWSVKRAMLSQGYMLDRSNDSGVLTGTRDLQPTPKLNVTLHLQTSCADNKNGTSIVFVTATREDSKLQRMKQTTSAGIGPATLTLPSGSAEVMGTVRRETIKDPGFYAEFFRIVQGFVADEGREHPQDRHAELTRQPAGDPPPAADAPAERSAERPASNGPTQ